MTDLNTTMLRQHEQDVDSADKHFERHVKPLLKRAREEVVDELISGGMAGRFQLEDVLDTECQDDYKQFLAMVSIAVITGDNVRLWKRVHEMTERFVDSQPRLIEDRAYRLAEDA